MTLREMAKRHGRPSRSDAGFTLTELLVAIVLFAIVGGAITMAATSGLHHQREVQDRGDALAQARTALQRIDRDIRSTSALAYVGSTAIAMNETGSGTTTQVCYWVDTTGTQLLTRSIAYSPSTKCLTASSTPTVLLRNLVNTSTTSVFTTNAGCVGSTACVNTVTVQISVQPSSLNKPVTVTDNGTELRNAS